MKKVYINGNLVDISQDALKTFSVTKSIADVETIQDRSSSYSKTVTAPLNNANKITFNFPDDINSDIQNVEYFAVVEDDGMDIMVGYATLEKSLYSIYQMGEIEFTIVGDSAAWQTKLNQANLSDIDLSDYDHIFNPTNVVGSETAGLPYVYDLADRGLSYFAAIYDRVSIYDRFPTLKVKYLLEKCYTNAGFTIDSDFKDSAFFAKVVLPYTGSGLKNSEQFRVYNRARATRDTSNYTLTGLGIIKLPFNNAANSGSAIEPYSGFPYSSIHIDEVNNWYKVPYDMVTKFKASVKLFWNYGGAYTDNRVFISVINEKASGSTGYPAFGELLAQVEANVTPGGDFYVNIETDWCHLGKDSKVYLKINSAPDLWGLGTYYFMEGSYFYNEIDTQLCNGQTLEWAENMPNMNQLDFLRGLKHAFNLHFVTDNINRRVKFEPRDDIYNIDAVDWTSKLDVGRTIEIEDIGKDYTKKVRLGFGTSSNDAYLNKINEGQITPYMAKDVDITHASANDGITEMINPVFNATMMDSAFRIGLSQQKIPKIWGAVDQIIPPRVLDIGFRLWIYNGVQSLPDEDMLLLMEWDAAEYTEVGATRTDFPQFYSFDTGEENDNSLNFLDQFNCSGLFEKYYKNSFELVNKGRRLTAYFNLSSLDVSELDLTRLILIRQNNEPCLYIIDKISDYQEGQITKVSLITYFGNKPIEPITRLNFEDGNLPIINTQRSAIGSITSGIVNGVFEIRKSTPSGSETILSVERGIIKPGATPVYTEISGITYPAYTVVDGEVIPVVTL